MSFPDNLRLAILQEIEACSIRELQMAFGRMTDRYRAGKNSEEFFNSPAACQAYLAVRMPATFAAIDAVLRACRERLISWQPRSLVDIGAGPGTGGWAAMEQFDCLETICFIERNIRMRTIGQKLAAHATSSVIQKAQWLDSGAIPFADLALLSYLIGELSVTERNELLETLWKKGTSVIVVIEPGTPAGFQRILEIRQTAIQWGAEIIAPCTHKKECPMQTQSWCHFPARVERTRLHLLLKKGSLGYEDEKFCYIAFGKKSIEPALGRIVGNPKKNSGFIQIPLCSEGQIKEIVVSRKQESYRSARKSVYGDLWM